MIKFVVVDSCSILRPIAKVQKSYLKDINFIEQTKLHKNNPCLSGCHSARGKSLYTKLPIKQSSYTNHLQSECWALFFANIFTSAVETEILSQSTSKPLELKRYIDDLSSLRDTNREEMSELIEQANRHYPTIKLTAEISDKEITFLHRCSKLTMRIGYVHT